MLSGCEGQLTAFARRGVRLLVGGLELVELGESQREWNASASENGQLAAGVGSAPE